MTPEQKIVRKIVADKAHEAGDGLMGGGVSACVVVFISNGNIERFCFVNAGEKEAMTLIGGMHFMESDILKAFGRNGSVMKRLPGEVN